MSKKIVDLHSYKIEKSLKDNGFIVKKDKNKRIKILIKMNDNE